MYPQSGQRSGVENIFRYFHVLICLQMPENGWMQLLAAAGEPFYSKIRQRHTGPNQNYFLRSAMVRTA